MNTLLLLVAHGTVENLDEMPEFLLKIRRGRPVPPELLAELVHRYTHIGGSPHLQETRAQADALAAATGLEVRVAMRLWKPSVSDVLANVSEGTRVVLVPLAPFSVSVYAEAARTELARLASPPTLLCVAPYGANPQLVSAHVAQLQAAIVANSVSLGDDTEVIVTAHSLPTVAIAAGDTYAAEFEGAVSAVQDALGHQPTLAYQSQGAGGGEWLGPTLLDALGAAKAAGKRRVLVSPIGFLSEHVETLYDLDVEARAQAEALGLDFIRVPALGTHSLFIESLKSEVFRALRADAEGATAQI